MATDGSELHLMTEDDEPPGGCLGVAGGLGLMAYGFLILGMATVGLAGIAWVIYVTLLMSQEAGSELSAGFEVEPWRLQEIRGWGVLPEGVTPALYHDHSNAVDGSSGCLVVGGEVLVWAEEELTAEVALEGASVRGVDEGHFTVTVENGPERADCWFRPGEGGERFLRMLEAETR